MYEELRNVLHKFNDGYVNRDVHTLDAFMDELFVAGPSTVILGTCDDELCLGIERSKELIKNDWLYWSDFRVDPEQAIFHPVGDAYWFAVVASIRYEFTTSDAKHERLLGFVKGQLETAEIGALEGLTTIGWGLAHYLFPTPEETRTYLWPVRLTGVIRHDQDRWKFQYLQFCLPSASSPDQRQGTPALDHLYKGQAIDTTEFGQSPCYDELVDCLRRFIADLTCGEIDAATGQFSQGGLRLVIDPQDGVIQPGNVAEKLARLRDRWGALSPRYESALTFSHGELAWLVCDGVAHQSVGSERVLSQRVAEIRELIDTDLPALDKLHRTQIGIATALKDIASGSDYHWPFRLEMALSRAGGIWRIEAVHLSFPFYWIFEHKIPAQRVKA